MMRTTQAAMIKNPVFLLASGWLFLMTAQAAEPPQLRAHDTVFLAPPAASPSFTLEMQGSDHRWRLELDDNLEPFQQLPAKQAAALKAGDSRFLRGRIANRPDSWIRLNWTGQRWWGAIHDGKELYLADRANNFDWHGQSRPAANNTVLFRASDLETDIFIDHAGISLDANTALDGRLSAPASDLRLASGFLAMPVTIVSDVEFQQEYGNQNLDIVAGRINFVDGIYSSQAGYGIALHHYQPLANNGPLTETDAGTLIENFGAFMFSGSGSNIPFQGLAHLFTARSQDGGIAGIAYLNVLCNTAFGYGIDWETGYGETIQGLVLAHELGHNFSAPHDGEDSCAHETERGIMNPSINGLQEFSQCSLDHIQSAASQATCMIEPDDHNLIFEDRFESNQP
ncbi:MAG TPA: M12 family metallo-peptidase [Wenzhouxiangella sp.]|nr:M12 family metallo-peptidase [Wenzhouxiangella sp.]